MPINKNDIMKKYLSILALMVSVFAMAQEQKVLAGRDVNE